MGLLDFFRKKPKTVKKEEKSFKGSWNPDTLEHDQAQAEEVAEKRYHVVQEGESLSTIAQKYYGKAERWQLIYQANQDKIKSPDLIHPGQKLFIPPGES
jgi:nucleoid-associated protein YgaU